MRYNRKISCYEVPVNVNIELTEKCALQCPFCFHDYGHSIDLDFSLLKNYLIQLKKIGTYSIQYSGGDPLLYPYLEDAIKYAHKLGLYIRLSTSGNTMTFCDAIKLKAAGLDCCYFSLNGSKKEIHNKTRTGFEKTIEAIHIAKKTGLPCRINWVANHTNISDLINVIELAKSMNVEAIDILANKSNYKNEVLYPYDKSDLLYLKNICEEYPDYLYVEDCFTELRLLLHGTKIPIIDKGCKAGRFHMAIDVHGNFLPCPHLEMFKEQKDDILYYWKNSVILGKIREYFQKGMDESFDVVNGSIKNACNICDYKRYCNPCYVEKDGRLLRKVKVQSCIISNKLNLVER